MAYMYVLQVMDEGNQLAIGLFKQLKYAKMAAKNYAVELRKTFFCRITRCPVNKTPNGTLIEKM